MSKRKTIVNLLVEALKQINGSPPFKSNLYNKNVIPKNKFWDEIKDFPFICAVTGQESREYHPSNFSWGFLNISLKLYTYGEDCEEKLEQLLTEVETLIDQNQELGGLTTEILVTSIITDEGLLAPYGVGEMNLQVRYPIIRV